MTAPRTDPQSTVPVEPLTAEALDSIRRALEPGAPSPYSEFEANLARSFLATLDAARASQPITATAEDVIADALVAAFDATNPRDLEVIQRNLLAALPVREDEPTGIDVETLTRAMERAMAAVDDEWTIPEFADLTQVEYDRLTREASHVR